MLKIRMDVIPILIIASLAAAVPGLHAQEPMALVSGQTSLVKTQTWIDFLKENEIAVDHYVFSELPKVKDKNFITIIGGLDEPGVRNVIVELCGAEEAAALSAKDAKKMYLKENVWKPGQIVLIFAGANADAAAAVRVENRDKWMKYLKDWFGIGDMPGGLRAY